MNGGAGIDMWSRSLSVAVIALALVLTGCLGAHHRSEHKCKREHHGESYRKHHGACYYKDAVYSRGALKCVEKRLLECSENGHWVVLQGQTCG